METGSSETRGSEIARLLGVIGGVILLFVGLSGLHRGFVGVFDRYDVVDMAPQEQEHEYDYTGQASRGELGVEAVGVTNFLVVTDDVDFELRFARVERVVLEVSGTSEPWTLERFGESIRVQAPDLRTRSDGNGEATDDPTTDEIDDSTPEDSSDPQTENSGQPTVTLTLPDWLYEHRLSGTIQIHGGTFATQGEFMDLSVTMTDGVADISGWTDYIAVDMSGGTANMSLKDVAEAWVEVSGQAVLTGEFKDLQPSMVTLQGIGGSVDLTLPNTEPYQMGVDNLHGILTNNLDIDDVSPYYVDATIAGGEVVLRQGAR